METTAGEPPGGEPSPWQAALSQYYGSSISLNPRPLPVSGAPYVCHEGDSEMPCPHSDHPLGSYPGTLFSRCPRVRSRQDSPQPGGSKRRAPTCVPSRTPSAFLEPLQAEGGISPRPFPREPLQGRGGRMPELRLLGSSCHPRKPLAGCGSVCLGLWCGSLTCLRPRG